MKIKYNWIAIAIAAIASLGLGTWQAVVNAGGGEFFLDKSSYSLIIFGFTIFTFIFGAVLTVIDRETPKTYSIGKNFLAGLLGLLVSICYISDGIIAFTSLSGQENLILLIMTKLLELFAGGILIAESVSSIMGKNIIKSKPLLTIAVPIMFAFRLIMLFFEYTKISVQSSEMFDIVAVAFASLFMYYHAVMFAGLKKSCVKSLFLFAAPLICASFANGTDIVVSAVLAGEFSISGMIMTVSDVLLCLYAMCLLAEITRRAGKQYLNDFADDMDIAVPEKAADTPVINEELDQTYSSFEEIESFGKSTPHIRRETILSEPAANVEPKSENPDVASHADALHEALTNNLASDNDIAEETVSKHVQTEDEAEDNQADDIPAIVDKNTNVESEPIPEPTQSSLPTSDGVDMDRINRLLSEFERDHM